MEGNCGRPAMILTRPQSPSLPSSHHEGDATGPVMFETASGDGKNPKTRTTTHIHHRDRTGFRDQW